MAPCNRIEAVAVFAFLLFVAAPISAQDRIFHVSRIALLAGTGADLATTSYCLGARTCRELNPLLAPIRHPIALGATKMGIAGAQLLLVAKVHQTHPKLATALNLASASLYFWVAARNTSHDRRILSRN